MIRAQGTAAVVEQLDAIAEAVTRGMTAAIAAETRAMQTEAKNRCPVETGALRESITGRMQAQGACVEGTVGSGLAYAPLVELGTLQKPPQPYLTPALRMRKSVLAERIRQTVRQAVTTAGTRQKEETE